MSCNTKVDENIQRGLYKSWLFVKDAIEQGNMSIQTLKELNDCFFDLLESGDPEAEQFMEMVCLHLDNKDLKKETVSPDEKNLTGLENRCVPVVEHFFEMICSNQDKKETLSPDEKDFFQKILTMWENRELEI